MYGIFTYIWVFFGREHHELCTNLAVPEAFFLLLDLLMWGPSRPNLAVRKLSRWCTSSACFYDPMGLVDWDQPWRPMPAPPRIFARVQIKNGLGGGSRGQHQWFDFFFSGEFWGIFQLSVKWMR